MQLLGVWVLTEHGQGVERALGRAWGMLQEVPII